MTISKKQKKIGLAAGAAVLLAAGAAWWLHSRSKVPKGIAYGNGRIEATTVAIAPKFAARIGEVLNHEGDMVQKGQALVKMDVRDLDKQVRSAEALAVERRSAYVLAEKTYKRSKKLYVTGDIALKDLQQDESAYQSARAAFESAKADAEKIRVDLGDSTLFAPITGRVLYRSHEPGEVVAAGTAILTVLDLTDVYMQFYLPAEQATKVLIGADARILLDALPKQPIPAKVTFVESRSQFTPKEVETRSEREKLMFRVKLNIDPEILRAHIQQVKTGLPGLGYIRIDEKTAWPEYLVPPESRGK